MKTRQSIRSKTSRPRIKIPARELCCTSSRCNFPLPASARVRVSVRLEMPTARSACLCEREWTSVALTHPKRRPVQPVIQKKPNKKKKKPHKRKGNRTKQQEPNYPGRQIQKQTRQWDINKYSHMAAAEGSEWTGTAAFRHLRCWEIDSPLSCHSHTCNMSLPEKERCSLGILAKFSQLNGEVHESQTDDKKYCFFLMVKINNPPFVLVSCYRLIVIATILSVLLILQCIPWVQCDWISLGVLMELTGRRGASYSTVLPFSK